VVSGLFMSLVYTPTLSQHFSYKNVFDAYREQARPGEPLIVAGISGTGPEFYMGGKVERVSGAAKVGEVLGRPGRQFVIAPATDLCAIEQQAERGGFPYHVAFSENSQFFLYTNQLSGGQPDLNPLRRMIFRERPASLGTPVAFRFRAPSGGEIELVGVDIPRTVKKGAAFKARLTFHVLKQLSSDYQILMHFDRAGQRFQGDHWPLDKLCGTQFWQEGDYVVDEATITAGGMTNPRGEYTLYTGLFSGGSGNWKNLEVVSGNGEKDQRVKVGTIIVE
jgi:hypothetical protein